MKKIWSERIIISEGYDESWYALYATAHWDKATGTLRLEMEEQHGNPYDSMPAFIHDPILTTLQRREVATRFVIENIDAKVRQLQHRPVETPSPFDMVSA